MGALLSLPLLALPSVGTVRSPSHLAPTSTDRYTAGDDGRKLLWSGYMLSSVLCLRSIPVQVSRDKEFPAVAQKALTGA